MFIFFSKLFENFENKKDYYLSIFLMGIFLGIAFMYSQSINFEKIFIVSFPLITFDHHFLVTTHPVAF